MADDNMPRSTSAAASFDGNIMKQHMKNGDSFSNFRSSTAPLATQATQIPMSSEPRFQRPTSSPALLAQQSNEKKRTHIDIDNSGRIQQPTTSIGPIRAALPSYDPRLLLNPKSLHSTKQRKDDTLDTASSSEVETPPQRPLSAAPHFVFDSPTQDALLHEQPDDEGVGYGKLIEQVHNVTKREERPVKRQKTEHSSEEDMNGSVAFAGGSKGGEIGEYMRQKRKEGLQESGPTLNVVDLTADDDEEVTVVQSIEDKEVCYGRVDNAKVQAHQVPFPNPKAIYLSKTDWPSMKLHLQRFPGKNLIIRVIDPAGHDFGNIDVRSSLGLVPLMDSAFSNVRLQARLDSRKKKANEYPGMLTSESYLATINVYGPKRHASAIGKFLSQKQVYLRQPFNVDKGVEVDNPHAARHSILPRTSFPGTPIGAGSTSYVTRTVEEIRTDVVTMFDSLEKSENLPEMEVDSRVTTPLLSHQKQGLYFMTDREKAKELTDQEDKNSLWRLSHRPNGQPMFFNVITGREERSRPPETRGGILADMMGLGKTLSILSLIVGSLDDALEWSKQSPPAATDNGITLKSNSKTTLLVAPLSVVSNWEEQIAAHIKPGTLSCYIHHGNNRCKTIQALAQFDVVVTTYSIVSSEFNGRSKKRDASPLLQTNFFRIVLDEAHMIREQSTRQFQAISVLSAQRRWAVTGTPVQNRLDDLGALIRFLRIKPFDEKGAFTQFILSPFKNADPEILFKLRLLVNSITLRRLKDRIDLPPRHEQIVKLNFSKDERELYEWFAKDSINRMNIITKDRAKGLAGRTYVHVLRAILRLRLICAHGKDLLSEDDLKLTEGFSSTNAIDLDDEDDGKPLISKRQAYEMLMLFKETDSDICAQCMKRIGPKDTNIEDGKDEVIGCMLPCYQMICNDCIGEVKKSIAQKATDNHFVCPFCEQYLRVSFFNLTQDGIEDAEEAKIAAQDNPRQAKMMGRYGGPHTKTTALLGALLDAKYESMEHPDEPPIKSVVFSGWTSHLDLIQIALEENGIHFVRLDGKMSRTQRATSLQVFRDDLTVPVILVSITAGGLGLNLTTASRVFVMEPQFNPAAEAQAVDRVHRLGQKREVTITRFIMDGSFEEKMLALQDKKRNLADISMGKGKLDKAETAKRRMEELRSLFK